jgi:hypothetical protein
VALWREYQQIDCEQHVMPSGSKSLKSCPSQPLIIVNEKRLAQFEQALAFGFL